MKFFLTALEIVVAVGLIGAILIQVKGTGLGSSFGGSGEFYSSRRGVEKIVLYATVFLSVVFALLSVVLLTYV